MVKRTFLFLFFLLYVDGAIAASIRVQPLVVEKKATEVELQLKDRIMILPVQFSLSSQELQQESSADEQRPEAIDQLYQEFFNRAFENSPEIQAAQLRKDQKEAELLTSRSRRYAPQLDLELSRNRVWQEDDTVEPREFQDTDTVTDWRLDLDLPLYRRTNVVDFERAGLDYELAQMNLAISIYELDVRLRRLLGEYLVTGYALANLDESILLSRDHVHRTRRGYELGNLTKLELLRAEADLTSLEAQVEINRRKMANALRDINSLSGLESGTGLIERLDTLLVAEDSAAGYIRTFSQLENKLQQFERLAGQWSEQDIADFFLAHSLLYKQLFLENALDKNQAKRLTENEWPELAIRGQLEREEDTEFKDFNGEGSIGLVLKIPLFSGGTLISSRRAEIEAEHLANVESYDRVLSQIQTLVAGRKAINSLRQVYDRQQLLLTQQEEIVQLSFTSHELRQTSMQDLLISKNRLINTRNQLMTTTLEISNLLYRFLWEVGAPLAMLSKAPGKEEQVGR